MKLTYMKIIVYLLSEQVKILKCGNQSTETKVRKPKYGSKKQTRLLMLVSYWFTNVCWGLVAKSWLYCCNVRAGSWGLGLQWASLSQCKLLPVSAARSKPRLTVSGPTMLVLCSWCSHDSDVDANVVIASPIIFTNGSTSHITTVETTANDHRSLGMRPQ